MSFNTLQIGNPLDPPHPNGAIPPKIGVADAAIPNPKNEGAAEAYFKKVHADLIDSPEKLHQASLLQQLQRNELVEQLKKHENLFVHLNLSSKAKGTNFEGTSATSVVDWSTTFLKILQNEKLSIGANFDLNKLLQESESLLAFSQKIEALRSTKTSREQIQLFTKELAESVRDLKKGSSLIMEGGANSWKAKKQMGMYYRFTKQDNNKYKVEIYYHGSAESPWQGYWYNDQGVKIQSPATLVDVEFKELFFSEDRNNIQLGFFQSLVEMLVYPDVYPYHVDTNYEIKDAWKAFFRIQHRLVPVDKATRIFNKVAVAATYKQKVLNALFRDTIKDSRVYKSYTFKSKLFSLVNMYHAYGDKLNTPNALHVRRQLFQAAESLCQKVIKYSKTIDQYPEFSQEEIYRFYATALDIQQRVKVAEAEAFASSNLKELEVDRKEDTRFNIPPLPRIENAVAVQEDTEAPIINFSEIKPVQFKHYLFDFYYDVWTNTQDNDVRNALVEKFLESLPIPIKFPDDPFWSHVEADAECMRILENMFENYCDFVAEKHPARRSEEHNTMMTAMAIAHQLCWSIDKKSGKNYLENCSMSFSHFRNLFYKNSYLGIQEPDALKRRLQLLNYFENTRKKDEIFNYVKGKKDPKYRKPELNIFKKLLKGDTLSDESIISIIGTENNPCFEQTPHIFYAMKMMMNTLDSLGLGEQQPGWNDPTKADDGLSFISKLLKSMQEESQAKNLIKLQTVPSDKKKYAEISSVLCDPSSSISTMIYRLRNHLDWLDNDDKMNDLIIHILYKPYFRTKKSDPIIPLFEALEFQSEQILEQLQRLIAEGLHHHLYEKEPRHMNTKAALFLVKLAHQIEKAYFQIHHKPMNRLYDEKDLDFIKNTLISSEAIAYPDLFNLLLHRMDQVMTTPPETWSADAWKDLYANWIIIRTNPLLEYSPQVDQRLLNDMKKRMVHLHPIFNELADKDRGLANQVCDHVAQELGLGEDPKVIKLRMLRDLKRDDLVKPTNTSWTKQSDLNFKRISKNTFMSINLFTGEVGTHEGSLINRGVDFTHPSFKRVFGNRPLQINGYGQILSFEDQFYGSCYVVDGDVENGIRRRIGNRTYSYVLPDFFEDKLPLALTSSYCHWIWQSETTKKSHVIFSDQQTGEARYEIDEQGYLHPYNSQETLELLDYENSLLTQFETPSQILCWSSDSHRNRIEFLRYKTKNSKCLTFLQRDGRWLYEQDPSYYIENNSQCGYCGNFKNFLLLRHVDGKQQKVLIPLGIIYSYEFSDHAYTNIASLSFIKSEERLYEYLEFPIKNGEPVGETAVHWLSLTQIYAAQKNYVKALECLNHVTVSDEMTPVISNMFSAILTSGRHTSDYTSNACALRLHAFMLTKKMNKKWDFLGSEKDIHKDLAQIYEAYLFGLNTVYEPLRLPVKMELNLQRFLEHGYELRETFLNTQEKSTASLEIQNVQAFYDCRHWPFKTVSEIAEHSLAIKSIEELLSKLTCENLKNSIYSLDFFAYYKVLKSGTKTQKDNLLYLLEWRVFSDQKNFELMFGLLQFVYLFPDLAPELPQETNHPETMVTWLQKLLVAYKVKVSAENSRYSTEPFHPQIAVSSFRSPNYKPLKTKEIKASQKVDDIAVLNIELVNKPFEDSLKVLRKQFLQKKKTTAEQLRSIKLTLNPNELSETEKPLSEIIEKEFSAFNDNLQEGKKRQILDLGYTFKLGKEDEAQKSLEGLRQIGEKRCEQLKDEILQEVRRKPVDPKKQLEMGLTRIGLAAQDLTLMDLARAAGTGRMQRYQALLPHFTSSEIQNLHNKVVEYMVEQTTLDQVHKTLEPLEKLVKEKQLSEAEKHSLLTEATIAFSQKRTYQVDNDHLAALYFEYASCVRLRKEQASRFQEIVDAIFDSKDNLLDKGLIFQMIQGAGKSAVMLSRLMELVAERGYRSILVCHQSQIEAAKGSMKRYQRERFGKNVITLNYSGSELEKLSVLDEIWDKLKAAKEEKDSVIMSSETVQSLQLMLIQLLLERKKIEVESLQKETDEKIKLLMAINGDLMENAVGMLDEVDLTLNMLQRVNFPIGERSHIAKQRIDLVHQIYSVLASPECDPYIGLSRNDQQNHLEKDYWEKAVPLIAKKLSGSNQELLLREHEEAFERYLLNKIDKEIELLAVGDPKKPSKRKFETLTDIEKADFAFMRYLHITLARSLDSSNKEAAQLIGLARGLVRSVIPLTLKKSFNRDYGYAELNPESIIPYLGVDIPADTEFGNVYEHLCYCFQAAVNVPISKGAIERFARRLKELAEVHVGLGEKFDETAEAQQYLEQTGIKLSEAFLDGNLEIAAIAMNQTIEKRLSIQAEIANLFITYYSSYLSSSPLALVDQFKTPVGCSATLSNVNSYHMKMSDVMTDKGAEGKVIGTLFDRTNGGKDPTITVKSTDLPAMIRECLDPIPVQRAQCLIDGGCLFKKFKTLKVATELLAYFKEKEANQTIKGVLFYHRQAKQESFALLKDDTNGQPEIILLKDPSRKEIEAHGIKIHEVFFNLDELRGIGTDIILRSDAMGVVTASGASVNVLSQNLLRARGYFIGQDLRLAALDTTPKVLMGGQSTPLALVKTGLKNQALNKSDETLRSLKEQSPNAIRTELIRKLLTMKPDEAAKLVESYESFFVISLEDKPYEDFAFIEEKATAAEIIKEIGDAQVKKFESVEHALNKDSAIKIKEIVTAQNSKLIERAGLLPELKRKFIKTSTQELGLHFRQTEKMAIANKLRVSIQMKQEEQSYNTNSHEEVFNEVAWNGLAVDSWNIPSLGPEICAASDILKDCDRTDGWISLKGLYRTDYSKCFPFNIKLTENLRYTFNVPLPVFHQLQKPAENVLIHRLQDGTVECIMLSQRDADFWMNRGKTPPNVWMFNAEGELLLPGSDPLPSKANAGFWDEKDTAIWYVNLFNGNVAALEKRPLITEALLNTNDNLMQKFLYYRTAHQIKQRQLLDISPLYSLNRNLQGNFPLCKVRFARELAQKRKVEQMSEEEISDLNFPVHLVRFIPSEKVKVLKGVNQIRRLHRGQVNHVSPEQVKHLSAAQVVHLNKAELIQAIENTALIHCIPLEHASLLSEKQEKMHASGIRKLTDVKEIQAIRDPALIQEFGPLQVVHALPEQVPYIKNIYAHLLRQPVQIQALRGRGAINAIDGSMVFCLTNEQISELRDAKLLQLVHHKKIKFVHNDAVSCLDWQKQLPHLVPEQYPFVSAKQYEKIKNLEKLPDNLIPLWSRIGPGALVCFEGILRYAGKKAKEIYPSTKWHYLLGQMNQLTENDYLGTTQHEDLRISFNSNTSYKHKCKISPPAELLRCKNLKKLHLYHCDPVFFESEGLFSKHFPKLEELNVGEIIEMEVFPEDIFNLTQLKKLYVYSSKITTISSRIGELINLEYLDLKMNKLKEVPKEIEKLTKLYYLDLGYNKLTNIPAEICDLKKLGHLQLDNNILESIPDNITKLEKLHHLGISKNKLKSLPVGFANCKKLINFHFEGNLIKTVPDDLSQLNEDAFIGYLNNSFDEIPKFCFDRCESDNHDSKTIYLHGCNIKTLTSNPDVMKKLKKLHHLYLSANPIEELPEEIEQCFELQTLMMNGTKLKKLPEAMKNLKNLTRLGIAYTQIMDLPPFILDLPNLEVLELTGNLISPENPIVKQLIKNGVTVKFNDFTTEEGPGYVNLPVWRYMGKSDPNEKPTLVPEQFDKLFNEQRVYELIQLINSGENPDTLVGKEPILHWALRNQHDKLAEKILEKLQNNSPSLQFSYSTLSLVCDRTHPSTELIRLLMNKLGKEKLPLENVQEIFVKAKTCKNFIQQKKLYELLLPHIEDLPKSKMSTSLRKCAEKITAPTLFKRFLTWLGEYLQNRLLFKKMKRALSQVEKTPSLDKCGYGLYHFNIEMQKVINDVNSYIQKLDKGEISIDEAEKKAGVNRQELMELAREGNLTSAVAHIMISDMNLNPQFNLAKTLTNLCLEKTLIMNSAAEAVSSRAYTELTSLYGMRPHVAGMAVANGIKGVIQDVNSKIPEKFRSQAESEFYRPLIQACYWEKLIIKQEGVETVTDEVMQALAALQVNERILIPSGNPSHNVLIQVRRTSDQEYSLKIFNTMYHEGHDLDPNSTKFKTCLPIGSIPKKSIFNKEAWKKVIGAAWGYSNENLYGVVRNQLSIGGKRIEASDSPFEYSSGQLQMTCASTPWWHWLRHEVSEMFFEQSDPDAAYVVWRLIKKEIRQNLCSQLQDSETNTLVHRVHQATSGKIKKHAQLVALMEVAKDPSRFKETYKRLYGILEFLPKEELDELMGSPDRKFESFLVDSARWRVLHQASNRIAQEAVINPKLRQRLFRETGNPDLQFVFMTLSDFEYSRDCLTALLKDLANEKRWRLLGRTLGELVLEPKLWMLAISLCKEWLDKGPKGDVEKHGFHAVTDVQREFLCVCMEGKKQERVLRELAIHFRKQKNEDIAACFWAHYRKIMKDGLIGNLENNEIAVEDVPLVVTGVTDLAEIIKFLSAMRHYAFDSHVIKVIHELIGKAMAKDDAEFSALKGLATYLYERGHNHFAECISKRVQEAHKST